MTIKVKPSVAKEIWAIIYLALGIISVLSLKSDFTLPGTGWVFDLLAPVFGWGVFLVPLVFFMIAGILFF